jgi:hypothetical protein
MKLERSAFLPSGFPTAVLFLVISAMAVAGQVNVLTQHNNNARTGANLSETILTTSNVDVNSFGKLFTHSVDGKVFAQPLYMQGLNIAGGTHNVVFVATENNSVYAFDADSSGVTYWHKNLGAPFSISSCSDLTPVVGITGTPVIDLSTGTLYVATKLASGPSQKLHALSIFDGSEKFGGPVTVDDTDFNPDTQHQRPGLLLLNGVVYAGYGSHCDHGSYHGFLLAFDASTLTRLHSLNITPSGSDGSIWQSGTGLSADSAGNIYLITANGSWNGSSDFGESYVKLNSSLSVLDYFTPSNWASLNSGDTDLGAGGAMLVPPQYIVGLGKDGDMHLVDQNSMGHLGGGVQSFSAEAHADTTGMSPVYWQGPSKQYIFVSHGNSPTKSFEFTGSSINTAPLGTNSITQADRPGGMSLSANGNSEGILWLIGSDNIVRAYDAVNFPKELWDSHQNSSRDSMGSYVKFVAPTVANGKVYVATQNSLVVYGLLSGGGTLTSYEAEAAGNTFSGAVKPGACTGCSGGEKVRFIGDGASNFLVINNINVSTAGNYTLTIYYVVSGTRSFSISVNGGAAISFTVSGTTWEAPGAPVAVTIPLNAGSNSIKFFNNSAFAPDIDRITIQ